MKRLSLSFFLILFSNLGFGQLELVIPKGHSKSEVRLSKITRSNKIATWDESNNVLKIWDTENGKLLSERKNHIGQIYDCKIVEEKNILITASIDNTLVCQNFSSGQVLWTYGKAILSNEAWNSKNANPFTEIIVSSDQSLLFCRSKKKILIFDILTGKLIETIDVFQNSSYAPNLEGLHVYKNSIYLAGFNKTKRELDIYSWNATDKQITLEYTFKNDDFYNLAYVDENKFIFTEEYSKGNNAIAYIRKEKILKNKAQNILIDNNYKHYYSLSDDKMTLTEYDLQTDRLKCKYTNFVDFPFINLVSIQSINDSLIVMGFKDSLYQFNQLLFSIKKDSDTLGFLTSIHEFQTFQTRLQIHPNKNIYEIGIDGNTGFLFKNKIEYDFASFAFDFSKRNEFLTNDAPPFCAEQSRTLEFKQNKMVIDANSEYGFDISTYKLAKMNVDSVKQNNQIFVNEITVPSKDKDYIRQLEIRLNWFDAPLSFKPVIEKNLLIQDIITKDDDTSILVITQKVGKKLEYYIQFVDVKKERISKITKIPLKINSSINELRKNSNVDLRVGYYQKEDSTLILIENYTNISYIHFIKILKDNELHYLNSKMINSSIGSALYLPKKDLIFLNSLEDRIIYTYKFSEWKSLFKTAMFKNNDFVVYDDHYRFDGTKNAIEQLYFLCNLEMIDLNQVKDSLYVPNLAQRILNDENLNKKPKLSEINICGVAPVIEPIENSKSGNPCYRIIPRSGGVGDVEVSINGIVRIQTNANKLEKDQDGNYLLCIDNGLVTKYRDTSEETRLKVIAKTANNSMNSRGSVIAVKSKENKRLQKPSIHAVMIGVDDYDGEALDLKYAAKDANDLQLVLQKAAQNFFNIDDTNRVFFYNLIRDKTGNLKGKTPDKENILSTLKTIEIKSKPEDIFLLFFAGHGEIVDKDQLLFLTVESNKDDFKGVKMRELLDQMNKIPAGKRVLILDACHSGAAINNLNLSEYTGKRDIEDAEQQTQRLKELDKLASKSGFAIITASSSDQKALELPQYEHGLMTYALLNAMLNNKSSLDENNQLQLDKWLMATEEEVKKLNQNQSAERMVPINFTLGKVDDEVRSSIVLREIPSVYMDNVINKNTFKDNLKIKSLLTSSFQESSRGSDAKIMLADLPNSIKVNVLYEEIGEDIQANVLLFNENFESKFKVIGKNNNLSLFIQELMNQIRIQIQK